MDGFGSRGEAKHVMNVLGVATGCSNHGSLGRVSLASEAIEDPDVQERSQVAHRLERYRFTAR